jgi:Carboxypeptidase regulatory-like domain/TonB-dependent Receptor Plug Domain/TonB dependent receptor
MKMRLFLVICLGLLLPFSAMAQVSTGKITGSVTDSTGGVVQNAQVIVTNVATGLTRTLSTDSAGLYSAPNLPPGEYKTQTSMNGFQAQTKTGIEVSVGQTITLDFTLAPGSKTETVTVVDLAQQLVDTTTSVIGTVITERPVQDLPLNSRNFLDLVPLVPGVQPAAEGRTTQTSFNISGGRDVATGYLIDGLDISSPTNGGIRLSPAGLDSIGEFSVITNNFSAEYGRSMSGIINVKLRSGTNDLHGNVFEYFRNAVLDASQLGSGGKPLPYVFNQFGGSAGAPLIKNKLFIFGDYQGERIRQSTSAFENVPLPAMTKPNSSGFYDFSALCPAHGGTFVAGVCSAPQGQIFNPFTSPRAPFLNNQIPANLADPTSALMMSNFPAPTQNCVGNTPGCLFNYVIQQGNPVNIDGGDLRVDYNPTQNDRLSFGMIYRQLYQTMADLYGDQINGNLVVNVQGQPERLYTVNYTHVLNSSMVNEAVFGFTRDIIIGYKASGMQYQPSIAGLGGLNTDPKNPFTSGFPLFDTAGYGTIYGAPAGGPSNQTQNIPQLADNFSFIKGRHSFKTGFVARFREYNLQQSLFPRGFYIFNNFTTGNGIPPQFTITGDAFASELLGVPLEAQRNELTFGEFGQRIHEYGTYFQDDYKVTSRLTLNLGLRWDLYKPATEAKNHLANFDPVTLTMILPGNGVPDSTLDTNWHDFSPHVGFAYALGGNGKTAIRGGYAISYLPLVTQGVGSITDRLTENPPFNIAIGGTPLFGNVLGIPASTVSDGIPITQPTDPTMPPVGASVIYIPRSQPTPYTQQWSLGIQRELPGNILFDATYVGTAGVHLTVDLNANQGAPGGGAPALTPNLANVEALVGYGQSNYNALQIKVERRFSQGFYLLGSYTYSRSIDDASTTTQGDISNGNNSQPQNSFNLAADRGPSDFNATHRFVASYIYELPFGKDKKFMNSGERWKEELFGSWQVNGITVLQSGVAFTPLFSGGDAAIGASGTGSVRPNLVGDPNKAGPVAANPTCVAPAKIHNANNWFNPCAYTAPVNSFGDAGRNSLVGPGFVNFNFSLIKNFPLTERFNLQFRTEVFNLFNHTNLGLPNNSVDQPNAGVITSTINQAQLTAQTSRLIQFALKLVF